MPIRRTEFDSGLRVLTERMPGVRSVALGFWVQTGSRDEEPKISGSSPARLSKVMPRDTACLARTSIIVPTRW